MFLHTSIVGDERFAEETTATSRLGQTHRSSRTKSKCVGVGERACVGTAPTPDVGAIAAPDRGGNRCDSGWWASLASRVRPSFKRDDDVSRFGLVRLQAIRIGLAPVGKIYNFGPRSSRPSGAGGLHDAESVAVEEKCMLPEYVVQLRNHGVVVGNRLTLQLAQRSFDLDGV